ncbi:MULTISPECIES: DUF2017 domain-containing protein [unclassified Streptomyces]|uniref:DUF2017 domain-containing protein n=1 Tax=unclassified Streptomyces TaxID=2593676 RepID=UPI0016613F6E|nr:MULTISPECIES: DUF2017 domain-containing protein [unclassified Streptomyces]MBD0709882.1 hypothetical protein [Streptomyces sp. CBMA291]MBD0712671.1 hypothetical protein [Streptomyces sp. CBMA370]
MAGRFEPLPGGGAAVALDEVEISILRSLAVQLMELIGPGDEPEPDADPLAALFAEGPSEPPSDPALRRLFPDAYGDDSEELRAAASDFRRFTENDLRARKRQDALVVVRALDGLAAGGFDGSGGREGGDGGAVLKLTPEESRAWLGALNDLRLTIATRLEITEDEESERLYRLPDSDPRKPMVMAYLWLGALQESLVETLMA